MLGIGEGMQICLYDEDDDCIVLSDNLPNNSELVCKLVECNTGQANSHEGTHETNQLRPGARSPSPQLRSASPPAQFMSMNGT